MNGRPLVTTLHPMKKVRRIKKESPPFLYPLLPRWWVLLKWRKRAFHAFFAVQLLDGLGENQRSLFAERGKDLSDFIPRSTFLPC